MNSLPFLHERAEGLVLEVRVQPRASRNEWAGIHQGCLKVRLTAPPVEGAANKECIKFLAELLDVPKSDLEIVGGHKSRHKSILIRHLSLENIREVLHREGVV